MSDWIPIGHIVKAHGIKGFLKVKTDTDFLDSRFKKGTLLKCESHVVSVTLKVESFQETPKEALLKFETIDDRDAAETLLKSVVYFDQNNRETLEEDAFYYDQLEGLDVYLEEQLIGTVKAVHDYPQGAMLRIKTQEKDVLIPFLKAFIKAVSLENKRIEIHPWDGLL